MGDGMNGLATMIFVVSGAIIVGGASLFWFANRLIADEAGWRGPRRRGAMLTGAILGAVLGGCAMTATFFETVWAPPPTLRFLMPPGFRPHWVVLLEDRSHGRLIEWQGLELPFMGRWAEVAVPAGGVVRVASLGGLAGNDNAHAEWSDGATMIGITGGRAPAVSGATAFVAYQREQGQRYDPNDELPTSDKNVFARYLAAHESGRQGRAFDHPDSRNNRSYRAKGG